MKKLRVNNEIFEAEKIVKTDTSIVGYDINDNIIFAHRGIKDFTLFILEDEQTFDLPNITINELTNALADSQIKIMQQQELLNSTLQLVTDLQIQIVGGTV